MYCLVLYVKGLDYPQLCGDEGLQILSFAEAVERQKRANDYNPDPDPEMFYSIMLWSDYSRVKAERDLLPENQYWLDLGARNLRRKSGVK